MLVFRQKIFGQTYDVSYFIDLDLLSLLLAFLDFLLLLSHVIISLFIRMLRTAHDFLDLKQMNYRVGHTSFQFTK